MEIGFYNEFWQQDPYAAHSYLYSTDFQWRKYNQKSSDVSYFTDEALSTSIYRVNYPYCETLLKLQKDT